MYYTETMLRFSEYFRDRDIMSLRIGALIGRAYEPIINPANLKIEGWFASERRKKDEMILPSSEIREIISKGFVVDDHDAITHPEDLVRMDKLVTMRFEVIGKSLRTDQKRRLGKVVDYTVDDTTMLIQKLYVSRGAVRGLTKQDMLIDRSQIVEINNKAIVVRDTSIRVGSGSPATAAA